MITTAQLAAEIGINQRAVQKRIERLGITPELVGSVFVLTPLEAQQVREAEDKRKSTPEEPDVTIEE